MVVRAHSVEKLKRLLKDFEKNKEWADLVNWLTGLNQLLRHTKIKTLPNECILAKRLGKCDVSNRTSIAQCLNQSLPTSVHALALETYSIIFDTIRSTGQCWGKRLAYYSPGFFAFYQFARLEVKQRCNEILRRYYLQMGTEIVACINGLVTVMLTGLDDQSEEAVRSVEELLEELERRVGTRPLFCSVWLVTGLT